ncbi:MFS transporter [Geodermatophilus sp. YIM 151500]|uniref:MFS transporter n=1 Tax=Geodermatophilus sp. YIM 151500 TaxID=2984531 RepID=UPI0021E360FB|nr:MFS transporter [Geodermatophilus sp. YIM 151500]MCV2489807.1 MFS transporter [Geodermatophilus sp. YIM 151500]
MVSGLLVIAVTYGLTRYGIGLYLPQFRAELGLTSGVAGVIGGSSYLAYCVAALLGLRLVDRGRARRALWWAGGSAAAGSLVVACAEAAPVLAIGALVAGSGAGAASPALVAAVAGTVSPPAEPRSQAVVNSGTGAGVVAGGLVVLAWPVEWRWAWLGFAASALLVTWWADRSACWRPPAAAAGRRGCGRRPLRLVRPLTASVLAGAGGAGVWTFGPEATAGSGLSTQVTGLLWCLLGGAALLGGLSATLVRTAGLPAAWLVSAGTAAVGTVLLAWRPGAVAVAAVALALFGGGFVALSGVLIALGGRLAPEAAAQATALLFIALTTGQATGAVLLGALADAAGTPATLVAAAALLATAAVAVPSERSSARPVAAGGPDRPEAQDAAATAERSCRRQRVKRRGWFIPRTATGCPSRS